MKNREKTFYKLTTDVNLREIYDLADTSTENTFYEMGWFDKWGSHLRIYNNNIGFLDKLEGLVTIELLHNELESQFNNIHYYTALEWLDNTLLICKDRFRKSGEEILNEAIKWCETKKKVLSIKKPIKGKYSIKEVKIAYFCLGIKITKDNYLTILKKYTNSGSNKILQKQITKTSDLTATRDNRPADTKHLKSLKGAERLLSGINDKSAQNTIKQAISTFESNFNSKHN